MLTDKRIYRLWADACNSPTGPTIEVFARAVEAEARREALEEAALICDVLVQSPDDRAARCAAAIRALIDKP